MNSKIVVFLITGLNVGGAERVVMNLVSGFEGSGLEPVVISLTSKDRILGQYPNAANRVHFLDMDKGVVSFIVGIYKLLVTIRKLKPVVIHAHMFHAMVASCFSKIVSFKSRIVFTSHSFSGFTFPRNFIIWATRRFRDADVIFSSGQHSCLNSRRTTVIANGVPVSVPESEPVFRERHSNFFIFLFVGRLETPKNPVALVQAFSEMKHKSSELWIAGDGSLKQRVESMADSLGVLDRVRLLGLSDQVDQLLREADCLVLSSRWEGLPMVVLEAGAASLPVLSTPVGAVPEVLSDDCGYICSVNDLAKMMDHIIENYNEAEERGRAFYRRVLASYSVRNMVDGHLKLFSQLMGLDSDRA